MATLLSRQTANSIQEDGAGDESRTRDLNLGKVALYQLSYSRIAKSANSTQSNNLVKAAKHLVRHFCTLLNSRTVKKTFFLIDLCPILP